jgi:hypothetical protein
MLNNAYNVDTDKLYVAVCTLNSENNIFISDDGSIQHASHTITVPGDDRLFLCRAEGDFDRSEWGIEFDKDTGGFTVNGLDGIFEDSDSALEAAVSEFGIPAEIHDDLIEKIENARNQCFTQ